MTTRISVVDLNAAAPVSVSTSTVVMDWHETEVFGGALITGVNLSGSENITFILESAQLKGYPDADSPTKLAGPTQSCAFEIEPHTLRRWYRLTAHTDGPTFNAANATFEFQAVPG